MFLSCATARVVATDSVSVPTEESVKEKAVIIGEDTEKRDEYTKTFVLSDHTYMVAVYDEPVHVKNSNGNWEDIDNSMSIMNGNDSVDTQILQNTNGKYTIKLAKNSLNKHLVTYDLGEYILRWDFVDANKVFAEVITPTYQEPDNNDDKFLKLKDQQAQVIYREIYANVDVRYTISSAKLKEDIILKNSLAQNVFYSEYDIGSLMAVQSNDQTIELYDPGRPESAQIVLSAPVMSDAIGNISLDVKIEIVSQNNNKLIIKTTADQTWLTDLSTIYPVTIDPTTYTAQDISKIDDTFVSSWRPTTAYYYMGSTWIGKEGATYGTCRILVKYPTLPALGNGDKVISAKLNMLQDVGGFSSGGPSTLQLNLHEITQSWNLTTTTWNTNVSYDTNIVSDYFVTSAAYNVEYNTWDITKTVQKWYDGTLANNGVMIKATDTFEAGSVFVRNKYVGTGYGINGLYPSLQVTYVNTNGLEDLWTYTTQDMGRAGTAFVNNNTGNLVLMRDDIAISGGKLPVGITSFYNYDPKATGVRYSWKTNYEQTIASVSIGGTNYYKYLDGDGTTVYFKLVSGTWVDELNKGLTLTIDTGSTTARYVIKDKSYNTLEFNSSGYLVKLKDNSETVNSVSIIYASTLIDYITDSSGRKFDYTYTSSRLTKIEYLGTGSTALRTVSYAYNDTAKTMTVTYPDTKTVTYYYDTENKITKAVDIDNSTVEFAYMGSPKIIQTITEHATDGTTHGNLFTFSYKPNETKITDKYSQDVYYQFDNLGRTICIKDANNAAQYYEYGSSGGQNNKLTSVSKLQSTTINLAKNISFESTSDWAQYDSAGALNTPIYSTTSPLLGAKNLSISHPGTAGRVIYAYESIPVSLSSSEKASYTLSAYVKSTVVGAAHLSISINGVAQSTSTDVKVDAANVWQRISSTINISGTTVTSLQIRLVVDAAATVYFDGVQFETGVGMNRYNLVENPSLEYVTSTTPNGWTPVATTSSDLSVSTEAVFNSKSYKIVGDATSNKSLTQVIAVSGNTGDVFSFGGWAKANAIPYSSTRNFQMSLVFKNGTTVVNTETVPFNNASTAWQYAEAKAVATGTYTSVTVNFEYFDQLNTVYFDGAQVYREEFGKTYLYDDKGNLISAKDMEGNTDLTTYDDSNQLLKQVNADGTYVSYDYDFFHRVFAAQSSTGTSTYINYDVYGNPISTKIGITELGSKLIAYYKFENNMDDSSGNGYHGANYNGTFETGRVDNAIHFNGTTQYAELGNFKVPEIFTITMWVKNERVATNECLIGKNTATGGNQVLFGEYNSKLTATINTATADSGTKTLGYQFLVVEYEKINETTTHVKVYKDTYLVYDTDLAGVIGDTSTGKIWALGMEWDNSTKSDFFQGSVDELAFFKGALDETEIQSLYDQARVKQVVAKYDFNTASLGTIVDNSGNGHTATYTGGVSFVSGAMVLDGSTGYMQIPDFTIGQEMSVVMTIKPDVVKSFSLFAKHDTSGNNILIEGYYAGWHTRIRDDVYLLGSLTANTTYTVVYTLKRINLTQTIVQIYVNGVAQFAENKAITGVLENTTGKPWVIGQEWDGATASDFFDGTIDNLVIYNYELTSKEVTDNSAALTGGSYVPTIPVTAISVNGYKTINSLATYTTDGNYITSVTDSRGNTAYYDYNSTYGRLNSLRTPGETSAEATTYNYDAITGLVTSVTKAVDNKNYTNSYTYDFDRLIKIRHNGFDYDFTYDSFGNPLQVKVAGTALITHAYLGNNGLLDSSTYGNGAVVKYEYDGYQRVITKKVNTVLKFEYTYDNQGNLSSVIDHAGSTAVTYSYFYDFMNRLTKVVGSNSHNMLFTYDSYGRIDSLTNVINGTSYKNDYDYGDKDVAGEIPGLIYNVKLNGTTQLTYDFDQLARLSTRTIATTSPYTTTYTYLDGLGSNSTTTLLASMTNGTNAAFNYTYDANGNILTIKEGTITKATYTYDKMNQLIREDNVYSSKSIDYVYDVGGNIVSRTEYNYTGGVRGSLIKAFNYGYSTSWKDQMTSYDGQSITYDAIGNPTAYLNGVTLAWQNGRELASYTKNSVTTNYTYNDSGVRTSKEIGANATINYYLNGSSIVRQTDGTKTLDFFYDENGNLYGFKEGASMYYYLRNGQNDIIGILDNTGAQVVSYVYDSWGNPISSSGTLATTIGADNPFRYRGYYFDSETGLYYLNSRYYDPEVGRFTSSDDIISSVKSIFGYNSYSYSYNNPVNMSDESGHWPNWATKVVATIAIIGVLAIVTVATAGTGTMIAAVAAGALNGAAAGAISGAVFGGAIGYIKSGSLDGTLNGMACGMLSGAISGAITGGIKGGIDFSSAAKAAKINEFISAAGEKPETVLSSFRGTPKLETLKSDTTVFRVWGGETKELGHWVSPINYGADAISKLALPSQNSAINVSTFIIQKGTQVLTGIADDLGPQLGGGIQWWVSNLH
jgi:RHS repeat-associated protein